MLDVVRMGLERRDQIIGIWADAFARDPLMSWVFPDEAERVSSLKRWWGFTLDRLPPGSELHGTRIDGCVAYWQPPRLDSDSPHDGGTNGSDTSSSDPDGEDLGSGESEGQAAFVSMMFELVGDLAPSRMEALGRIHQARLPEPHWYLAVLGTSSDQQSRGLGGRVLAPMLERCDRTGTTAYLESSNPQNVSFYLRHGFESLGEFVVGDGVIVTPMSRQPRPPES